MIYPVHTINSSFSLSVCRVPETCAKHFSAPENLDAMQDTDWVSVEGSAKGELQHKGFVENSPFMCLQDQPFDLQLRKVFYIKSLSEAEGWFRNTTNLQGTHCNKYKYKCNKYNQFAGNSL